jgi:DNA-binding NarL/FixJ family response regulator
VGYARFSVLPEVDCVVAIAADTPIRVLIVDDHEIVRLGMRNLLDGTRFEVIGEACSGGEAMGLVASMRPGLVLMDIRMAGGDGLSTLGRLKLDFPELPVVLVSAYDNPTYFARAVALGAAGYVLKSVSREQLLASLDLVSRGEATWTRDELRRVTGALATPRPTSDIEVPLTQRESDVLRHLSLGLTNKEIAKLLNVSYETVKEHVQHILRKIGVTDRTQAAVWAVRNKLV